MVPVKLFFSYSHKDEDLRAELVKHLNILKRQGVVESWHDRNIDASSEWKSAIDDNLNNAQIILLLISADYLVSDYCYEIEMKRAMERQDVKEAIVIPIILRPCDWYGAPFASTSFQALPKGGSAVTTWPNRSDAFYSITSGIKIAVGRISAKFLMETSPKPLAMPSVHNIPYSRNHTFTGRAPLLEKIRSYFTDRKDLLGEHQQAQTGGRPSPSQTQVIIGPAGVGKTQLALEYAYRFAADYKTVWWAKADNPAAIERDYMELARALVLPVRHAPTSREIAGAVKRWLGIHSDWLLVFDDAQNMEDLRWYLPSAPGGHVLITSRNPDWPDVDSPLVVGDFTPDEAVDFLLRYTEQTDASAAAAVAKALQYSPLALEEVGANIKQSGITLAKYLGLLPPKAQQVLSGLSEQEMARVQEFLEKAGANVRCRGERSLEIDSARLAKLEPFVPFPALAASDAHVGDDVDELAQGVPPSTTNGQWRIGILFYRQPPDALALIRMADAQLRDRFVTIPIPFAAVERSLSTGGNCKSLLAEYAERYLPGANLFDDRNAIGDTATFFGRADLLHRLEEDLLKHQGIGLFGLRKSGKTSVLLQLLLTLQQHPVVHLDLQWHGGKQRFGAELFNEFLQRLSTILNLRSPGAAPAFEPFPRDAVCANVTLEFARRANELAEGFEQAGYKSPVICLLDEVERILPLPEDSREKVEEFNAFFGTLRALCQQQRRLSLLVADVHPDCNRINQWTQTGVPTNPVFKFFKEVFLRPFSSEDTVTMLLNIGRLMGCPEAFDAETLAQIHQVSGGHPFVARQLASLLCQKAHLNEESAISWQSAKRYVERPFTYSSTLKDYIGAGIWGDLEKRQFRSAMSALEVLSRRENTDEWMSESALRAQVDNGFSESDILEALQWLEAVGLTDRDETADSDRYRIRLPLLSQWLKMNLSDEELRQWQRA